MKFKELKDKNKEALIETLAVLKREKFNLRMLKAQNGLEKTSSVRECRKNYARVKTRLAQLKSV